MSKLQDFLDELTNRELASFYQHRYSQFMPNSQEKIDAEFTKREMNQSRLSDYTLTKEEVSSLVASRQICPNCFSTKFYYSTEIETITYSYASVDMKVDYKTCLVYLHQEEKDSDDKNKFLTGFGFIKALMNRKK